VDARGAGQVDARLAEPVVVVAADARAERLDPLEGVGGRELLRREPLGQHSGHVPDRVAGVGRRVGDPDLDVRQALIR
jgi:hypothetical protein